MLLCLLLRLLALLRQLCCLCWCCWNCWLGGILGCLRWLLWVGLWHVWNTRNIHLRYDDVRCCVGCILFLLICSRICSLLIVYCHSTSKDKEIVTIIALFVKKKKHWRLVSVVVLYFLMFVYAFLFFCRSSRIIIALTVSVAAFFLKLEMMSHAWTVV